jgi:hypothetical protein
VDLASMKKLSLLLLSLTLACQKPAGQEPICEKAPDQTKGLAVRALDSHYMAYDPVQGEDLSRNGLKISTLEQYQRVFASCCANRLDSLDFTQYDLLGLTTVNAGTNSSYIWEVQRDDAAKKVTYSVTEVYCRRSAPIDGRGNFVVVPKLPVGYPVEFVRNQR